MISRTNKIGWKKKTKYNRKRQLNSTLDQVLTLSYSLILNSHSSRESNFRVGCTWRAHARSRSKGARRDKDEVTKKKKPKEIKQYNTQERRGKEIRCPNQPLRTLPPPLNVGSLRKKKNEEGEGRKRREGRGWNDERFLVRWRIKTDRPVWPWPVTTHNQKK